MKLPTYKRSNSDDHIDKTYADSNFIKKRSSINLYNTYKITGLPGGKNWSDAINKKQLDNEVTEIKDKIIALEDETEGLRAELDQIVGINEEVAKLNNRLHDELDERIGHLEVSNKNHDIASNETLKVVDNIEYSYNELFKKHTELTEKVQHLETLRVERTRDMVLSVLSVLCENKLFSNPEVLEEKYDFDYKMQYQNVSNFLLPPENE